MIEQKEKLKHGEFTNWIKENLPFTDRTARNYIKLFNKRERLKTETVSVLKSAYKLLEKPKKKPAKEDEVKQMNRRIKQMLRELPISESLSGGNIVNGIPLNNEIQIFRIYSMMKVGKILNELKNRWGFTNNQARHFVGYIDYIRLECLPETDDKLELLSQKWIKECFPTLDILDGARLRESLFGSDIGDDLICIFSSLKFIGLDELEMHNYMIDNREGLSDDIDEYQNTMIESIAGKERVKQSLLTMCG